LLDQRTSLKSEQLVVQYS